MKYKALFGMEPGVYDRVYPQWIRDEFAQRVDLIDGVYSADTMHEHLDVLKDVDFVLGSWCCPVFNQAFLDAAPNLKAVFYAAGSLKSFTTPEFWAKEIPICSAWAANAIPVTEYTLAQILLSLKQTWHFMGLTNPNDERDHPEKRRERMPVAGGFKSKVSLISLGMIGRRVAELLQPFDIDIYAYDPFLKQEQVNDLGVTLVSLEEAFAIGDVVSLHTPWLKETENMITGELLASMKERATFINTARGAVVDEQAMFKVMEERTDLTALLDVVWPEPPAEDSPVYSLRNVIYTPHIAGSQGPECVRMSSYMLEELDRFLAGETLKWSVTEKQAAIMA